MCHYTHIHVLCHYSDTVCVSTVIQITCVITVIYIQSKMGMHVAIVHLPIVHLPIDPKLLTATFKDIKVHLVGGT